MKHVVTIMDRKKIGEDTYVYVTSHVAVGQIDEKTNIFKDENGHEYLSISAKGLGKTEIDRAYANTATFEDLRRIYPGKSIKEAKKDYEFAARQVVYIVGSLSSGDPYIAPLNIAEIKTKTENRFEEAKKNNFANATEVKGDNYKDMGDQEEDEEEYEDQMDPSIVELINEIVNKKYSVEELQHLRQVAFQRREDFENLIDTIDLQIDTQSNGQIKTYEDTAEKTQQRKKEQLEDQIEEDIKEQADQDEIDIQKLYEEVKRTLVAQDEPLLDVITEIDRKLQDKAFRKKGLMITGATGVGKTKMIETIAKILNRPYLKINATGLTVPGYKGTDIEEEIYRLYIDCGKDIEKVKQAIIFIDEIDKKGSDKKSDVSGKGVLNVLLPFIEGAIYQAADNTAKPTEVVDVDTTDMIKIIGGAFTDVYKNLTGKNSIGFGADVEASKRKREATIDDFVDKAQMPDEFMGRYAIIKLNDLDVEAIKQVALQAEDSSLKKQQELFKKFGVTLIPSDEFVTSIAKRAVERKTGVRGLDTLIDEATRVAYRDARMHKGEYETITLTEETIDNPKVYKKITRQ